MSRSPGMCAVSSDFLEELSDAYKGLMEDERTSEHGDMEGSF